MGIRSGRFRLTEAATIVSGGSGTFYRVLNSSDDDEISPGQKRSFKIRVKPGSSAGTYVTLEPRFSLDINLSGSVNDLEIEPTTTGDDGEVEGIYDLLRAEQDIRSGRFKFEAPIADRHPIVIAQGSGLTAIYRVYNSGKNPINVYDAEKDTGPNSTLIGTVSKDQSRDFKVANKDLYVHSPNSFEGIYELVEVI